MHLLKTRLFLAALCAAPLLAHAQDSAYDSGYRIGFLVGRFGPIVVIVALVVAALLRWVLRSRDRVDRDRESRW